jgi:hypothetical protein
VSVLLGCRSSSKIVKDFLSMVLGHFFPMEAATSPEKDTLGCKIATRFRRPLTAAEYGRLNSVISHIRAARHSWSVLAYNCNDFVADVARGMGMQTPTTLSLQAGPIAESAQLGRTPAQTWVSPAPSSPGSFAMFAAMRRASSRVSYLSVVFAAISCTQSSRDAGSQTSERTTTNGFV